MADLEVLHLSDLHWEDKKRNDYLIVVQALLADLERGVANGLFKPDVVVFSGDLVNSGEERAEFDRAWEALLVPALSTLGLDESRLFIVPGNHDISRKVVRDAPFVQRGLLEQLKSVDAVNQFIDGLNQNKSANMPAVERVSNFYQFADAISKDVHSSSALLRTFVRDVRGLKVGVACFDTAWRTTGEADDVDRAHLLLGERNVDQAIADLSDAQVRLAVMHHPLSWLTEFDEVSVTSRLFANFDAILCGHMHRATPQTQTSAQGTAVLSQTGSVFAGRKWFNGYQVMQLDLAASECTFVVRSYYDSPRRVFDAAVNVATEGRVTFPFAALKTGGEYLIVESFLRHARPTIRKAASDHMNMLDDKTATIDAKEAFIVPPLSKRVQTDENGEEETTERYEDVTAEEILRSPTSFIITGGRETGKTSLLHYLAVLCAEGITDQPRIPVLLDAETLKPNNYNLKRAITNYLGSLPKGFDADLAIREGRFLFLADNFAQSPDGPSALEQQIAANEKNRWICISRPRPGSLVEMVEAPEPLKPFAKVRLRPLPRRSIRALSRRWSPVIGSSDQDVFDAVMKQLKADGLPRTGYMVTLILWAMRQEKELDRVNEAILLSNVADHLLEKADFTQSIRGRLDPRAKEITLEYLAEFIGEHGGYAGLNEATTFLSELFKAKRLPFIAMDVMEELVKCGILERQEDGVRFKYKCFEEYFFALRMRSDAEVFQRVLRVGEYPRRAREIEMLAGLRRRNDDIIALLMKDMNDRAPAKLAAIERTDFDEIVGTSIGLELSRKELAALRRKRLTSDQVDDLLDTADRRTTGRNGEGDEGEEGRKGSKKPRDDRDTLVLVPDTPDRMSTAEYVVTADLLARVLRNSDFSDFEVKAPALRVVLETMAKLCVRFSRELREVLRETAEQAPADRRLSETEINFVIYYLGQLLVRIVASQLADQLSAPNMAPMAAELAEDRTSSLIEKLFLAYLLQGLRAPGWERHWSEVLREGSASGFVIENVIGQMRHVVNTQYLDDKEHAKLHKVIDTAEEVLGWSTEAKGHMLSDLKRAALQADMRDTI